MEKDGKRWKTMNNNDRRGKMIKNDEKRWKTMKNYETTIYEKLSVILICLILHQFTSIYLVLPQFTLIYLNLHHFTLIYLNLP